MVAYFQKPYGNKTYPFVNLIYNASHILIGGTTGSGKSVLIDDIIYSLLGTYTPKDLRLVLIDPKRVSLSKYRNLPHTIAYGCENCDILDILDMVIRIMERRYDEMQKTNSVKYDGAKILIIIDELADLMTTCRKQIVPKIQRIAQLGRASGIKMISATQAPNRKIIDGNIVVNFDGRIALHCLSSIESRQTLNRNGAEDLPLHGKALYLHNNGKYYELGVPLTADEEINKMINFWQNPTPEGWGSDRRFK